jgi:hypothetical protein
MGGAVAILEPTAAERDCAALSPAVIPEIDGALADLVALTVLAVNRLAPATLRSATFGTALKVVVSDPQIGAVFRAALLQMGERRTTDRLIEIVVESGAR